MSTTSLTADERETIIRWSDGDATASIWTAQRAVITKLRRNPAAVLVEEGMHGSTAWADFRLPASMITFRSKKRRGRKMSEAERAETARRLAAARSDSQRTDCVSSSEASEGYSSTPEGCTCCGKPVYTHENEFTRGLCEGCDLVRCDAYPGACREDAIRKAAARAGEAHREALDILAGM